MNDDEQPLVTLDPLVHWCPRHLERFRARWPHGYGLATVKLFEAAVMLPAVADACGELPDGKADTSQLPEALQRFSPLCCFIAGEKLNAIYELVGV